MTAKAGRGIHSLLLQSSSKGVAFCPLAIFAPLRDKTWRGRLMGGCLRLLAPGRRLLFQAPGLANLLFLHPARSPVKSGLVLDLSKSKICSATCGFMASKLRRYTYHVNYLPTQPCISRNLCNRDSLELNHLIAGFL